MYRGSNSSLAILEYDEELYWNISHFVSFFILRATFYNSLDDNSF